MKLEFQNQNRPSFFSLMLLLLALGFTACDKNGDEDINVIVPEEAAAVVESALLSGTAGVTDEVSDAALVADRYSGEEFASIDCGETFDSTITRSINKPRVTANYTSIGSWTVNCNNFMIPTSLDFGWNADSDCETERLVSEGNSVSSWTIGNLTAGSAWLIDGTYNSSGNQTSKVRNQTSFTSDLAITVSNLAVNKDSRKIDSGSGDFTLTGIGSGGSSFEFTGSITFHGNGMATITINGETFEVDLS